MTTPGTSENTPPLRIGFVGVGNMGQMAHLRHYPTLPECRVVAIAEPRAQLAARVASRYGVESVYSSAPQMLEKEELDGLVVPQPFDRHGQIVTPLYAYDIPLLTEKPLAASVEVGEQMITALEKSTSWHMVGYHKRSDPAVEWATTEIARLKSTQELGALRYVRLTMPPGDWIGGGFNDLLTSDEAIAPELQLPADPKPPGMNREQFQRYVQFVNFYIHQINLLRHLLGESYRVTHADKSGVLFVAESTSGVTGILEMAPYQTELGWDETALISFDAGYIQLRLHAPLTLNRAGEVEVFYGAKNKLPQRVIPVLPPEGAMRNQARNFLRAIKGEIAPPCEAHEALEDLKVARDYLSMHENFLTQ